ncbi:MULTISPECIES: RNA methyltransferase [Acidobacterium]|uniref:RNA methyltransferase, TrmH family protein n=1 Tax=Acidobacterium capsulatum (strain ATCC 51196 / DSM 11244 / BCRC 80197 / JCM 7670 / NBRC 15755 / NCIMB 13165 / 161) TaxID=240015 RepID=C1F3I9_ACIC5|nr:MULTISPECIES: RNA methyltransferase [Acidobacterium]ACO31973.1 RNA methyltransferase, TrmH family protein [Acidobacterium capsulatum ATCC 51196]HCT60213.1 RNA methyltransferase [Acidobacterium sp.]
MPNATERARTTRIVQSRHNSRVKELRAAFSHPGKGERGYIALEGELLLAEALRSGLAPAAVFIRSGQWEALERVAAKAPSRAALDTAEILELPADIFSSAVDTESPQGIAALLAPPRFDWDDLFPAHAPALLLVTASLQDPGNLGTLIRSAEAFGASGILTLPGTVNLWNAKVVRASAGSVFRMPVVARCEEEVLARLAAQGVTLFATTADGDLPATQAALTQPCALLIGNEGAGLTPHLLQAADARLAIPTPGPVESLNAAIAGSILLYEASRQRAASQREQ